MVKLGGRHGKLTDAASACGAGSICGAARARWRGARKRSVCVVRAPCATGEQCLSRRLHHARHHLAVEGARPFPRARIPRQPARRSSARQRRLPAGRQAQSGASSEAQALGGATRRGALSPRRSLCPRRSKEVMVAPRGIPQRRASGARARAAPHRDRIGTPTRWLTQSVYLGLSRVPQCPQLIVRRSSPGCRSLPHARSL